MVVFNANELQVFKVKQLRRLADYYAVKYNKRTTKTELIDKLLKALGLIYKDETEDQDVQMSVRIKRIKDSIGE